MHMNLGQLLTQRAGLSPDLEVYVEPSTDTRINYAQLNALVNRCCGAMGKLGLEPGGGTDRDHRLDVFEKLRKGEISVDDAVDSLGGPEED